MTGIIYPVVITAVFYPILRWAYAVAFGTKEDHENVDFDIPGYEQCHKYRKRIEEDIHATLNQPYEKVNIYSRDGLRLAGKYYHVSQDAPVVILFHGYRSSAARDCAGGFKIAKEQGCNILLVDQRAHGDSQGRTITMGIKERYDCLDWTNYVVNRLGTETKILIEGLSMGASTVLMASQLDLPENVKGIIADCGYSDVKEILMRVGGRLKLPFHLKLSPKFAYSISRMGAKIFGKFDPQEASPKKALENCKIPVLFIHGEKDRLVPVYMSHDNYNACQSEKELLIIPDANHGMSYYVDTEKYEKKVIKFMEKCLKNNVNVNG